MTIKIWTSSARPPLQTQSMLKVWEYYDISLETEREADDGQQNGRTYSHNNGNSYHH